MVNNSKRLEKQLSEVYGYKQIDYKCLYIMMADIIRSNLYVHCSSNINSFEWSHIDIRSVLYHSRYQINNIFEILDSSVSDYFLESVDKDPVEFIIDQLVAYGDVIKIKNGSIMAAPLNLVKIGESIGCALIGAIPIQNLGIPAERIRYEGVARIINDIEFTSDKIPLRSINDWIRIPSYKVGLNKWLESLLNSLTFNETVLTSDYEVFDVNSFTGFKVSTCWAGIDQYKGSNSEYIIVRTAIVGNRYRYWVVKGSIIDGKCMLAEFFDIYRFRIMCGIIKMNNKAPKLFYKKNNGEILIKFNTALIPREEMILIKTFSYPFPHIERHNNMWVVNEMIWDNIKPYLDELGFEYIRVDNIY